MRGDRMNNTERMNQISHAALYDFAAANTVLRNNNFLESVIVEVLSSPHEPTNMPNGKMAVYCFFLGSRSLKVGIAGPNSNARYRYQHYNPNGANSTLARSILIHSEKIGRAIPPNCVVGRWIKTWTDRVNFLLPATMGRDVLQQLELFMHARWQPVFEGRC